MIDFNVIISKLLNPVFFQMRNVLKFSRSNCCLLAESKLNIWNETIVNQKHTEYLKKYNFQSWYDKLGVYDYKLNMYFMDLIATTFDEQGMKLGSIQAVDIGSKNFYYGPALHQVYSQYSKLLHLHGIELDAYRVYTDLHSRFDYAQAYIQNLNKAQYFPMDFLEYKNEYNVATMFLPFVFERPLLLWGLPLRKYQPERLMKHTYMLLDSPGLWIITNQGKREQERQHQILSHLSIPYVDMGIFQSPFYSFDIPHYITVVKK